MSEAEKARQNKSGEFRPLGYAETNMLGKMQNNSGKTETLNHPILNVLQGIMWALQVASC